MFGIWTDGLVGFYEFLDYRALDIITSHQAILDEKYSNALSYDRKINDSLIFNFSEWINSDIHVKFSIEIELSIHVNIVSKIGSFLWACVIQVVCFSYEKVIITVEP